MRLKLFLFYFIWIIVNPEYAQTYNFRNYSEEEGLNQNYIYCISQSDKGFLNLSTGEGFCDFDGNKFQTYTDKNISEKFVTTHYTDQRDITWLGHSQKGISFLKNGKFFSLSGKKTDDYKVTQLSGDAENNIWGSTYGGGLFKVDSNFNFIEIFSPLQYVNALALNGKNEMLCGTTNGLKTLKLLKNNKVQITADDDLFKNKNIKQIVAVNKTQRSFWVTVEGEGIYGITNINGRYRSFIHFLPELASENNNVTCIFSDQYENLWIGLFGEGLRKISFKGDVLNGIYSLTKIDKQNGLKSQHIQSIFQDMEGNMWFGTFGAGLIEKPVEKFSFYGNKEGIPNTNIKKLLTAPHGNLWIGTDNCLGYYDMEKNSFTSFNSVSGFVNDKVNALAFDNDKTLWIGTESNGIYRLNTQTMRFENFSKLRKLNIPTINCIIHEKNKILFSSTEGIYSYNLDLDKIELINTEDGLLHNNVLHLFYDSKNRLWISSHGSPPYYIQNRKITAFKTIPELNSFNINCVTEDRNGNIWIGTEGDGVFKYDNNKFINYKTSDGLLSNYCTGIEVDDQNSVWVSHRDGLSEKKNSHKEFTNLTKQNGLLFSENNLNAIHKDLSGNLWFGTSQGLVHYDSEMGANPEIAPKLFITKIKLNEASYPPGEEIIKKYGYYSVHIDYLAIFLTDPKSVKYKYRLLGVDSTWKSTSLSYAEFPRLSDGNYTFEVTAFNDNDLCTSLPAEIRFRIEPPIWKKTWFYLVLLGSIFIITYIIVYLRIKNLKKMQAVLQETVRQKTYLLQKEKEEVEKIKIELEQKNKDITDSINYAKRLQDSLLPPDHMMDLLYDKKYFILYMPKDIVSGDFYWSASLQKNPENQLSLAAVVDCTGHGVPGAFLSIVANDFLKQCTIDNEVQGINEVLDFLNKNVSSNLNQSSNKIKMKDGMDIALIGIDYKQNKLFYSGANNPAYIFRKAKDKPELTVLKPTKQAIGLVTENSVKYDLQEFNLLAGDTIYLFSDGYADQFGGENDKKLNYKRFKEILAQAFELPVGLQKNFIEKKLMEWKGDTEQTDDICIMGIKI